MTLLSNIKKEIAAGGPLTFATFMEMALYHPEYGYYNSEREKIGPRGDFYTSSDVHPLFGTILARQCAQMWELLDCPSNWSLVEYGAGKGLLARDVLTALRDNHPAAWAGVSYHIIEISPAMIRRQKEVLQERDLPAEKIHWAGRLSDIGGAGGIRGVILANEVVDAFPVHLVKQTQAGLKEIYVNWYGNGLMEEEGDPSTPLLAQYFKNLNVSLAPGQRAEVNLAARQWLRELAAGLSRGFILIIDYGGESPELYHPSRYEGTLRCYHRHRLNNNPLIHVGEQDITASVNFSTLMHWAREEGLQVAGYTTQMDFLLNLGIMEAIPRPATAFAYDERTMRATMAVKKLILPEGMGSVFKVLALYKGLPQATLAGFKKFSEDKKNIERAGMGHK
ncbi:MAG: class I SAM-dependent methyltransferase [Thermoanaerobacteraceae bacterium]|nr:class I SAM-dependent methyltransferase [Thermoanaerobacteraceae bacterium]